MSIRLVTGLFVMAVAAQAATAQIQLVEVRDHPDASTEILWAAPTSSAPGISGQGVYRSEGDLIFASVDGVRRVRLEGTLMAEAISSAGGRIGLLLKNGRNAPMQLQVFTRDGALELSRDMPHHRDDPLPQIALSDVSNIIAYARPETAEVCFADGSASECVGLFKEAAYTHERNVLVDVSPDGRYVAVAAQREPAHPGLSDSDPNAYLFLFDRHGLLLWTRPLPQPGIRALAFSPSSGVAVSTYDAYRTPDVLQHTRLTTIEGETSADAPFGADAFVFRDEEMLLVTARQIAALDISGGTSRVVYREESVREVIGAAVGEPYDALLTGRRILTDDGFAFEALRLLHLDEAGALVASYDISVSPQHAPHVEIDAVSRRTVLVLDRETHIYGWPR